MTRRILAAWLAALAGSCSADPAPSRGPAEDEQAALGGEIAARATAGATTDTIPLSVVAAVAETERIPASEAARRLVDDAVAAVAARERGLDQRLPASWQLVAARARMTADRLRAEARAKGPPTDDEVKELSLRHWREVDRPVSVRVVHAVVRRPKKDDPALLARARELADEVRAAVLGVAGDEDFIAKAKAVPHGKELSIVAQTLPPFTDDGFSIEGPDVFREAFVKPAHALEKQGDTSAIVETEDGWHVIRLLERLPEQRMSFESRRLAFAEETYAMRARRELEARLAPLRQANAVAIAPSAEQLMRSLSVSPPAEGDDGPRP